MTRILVIGGGGQVGLELAATDVPDGVELVFPDRDELDFSRPESIRSFLGTGSWDAAINCAAWTAVDLAEERVADAFEANCQGVACLSEATGSIGVPLIHVSTDYVFDGRLGRPYTERDRTAPIGAYGASKLAGELAARHGNPRSIVLRTAWVLSAHRSNFLKTMLRLGFGNPVLRVVADQVGCPTSATDIAAALLEISMRLIGDPAAPAGVYHFVNSGEASWFELANHIFELAAAKGGPRPQVVPITTADYPTRATRPANSRLDCSKIAEDFGIVPRDWQSAVAEIIDKLFIADQVRSADA